MAEGSVVWDGEVLGDAVDAPYTAEKWTENEINTFCADPSVQGVILGSLAGGELEVTNPAGLQIDVADGNALVDGSSYANTGTSFNVVAPGAGTNYYTMVIRKTWATQLVRLALLGPSGASYPIQTQVDGTTWELPIAYISVTAAAAVAIIDGRRFVNPGGLPIARRQGGDSFNWQTPGTTNYLTGVNCPIAQGGSINAAAADPGITVTFPIPFLESPLVFCQPMDGAAKTFVVVRTVTATGFTATKYDDGGFLDDGVIMWHAMGPLQG